MNDVSLIDQLTDWYVTAERVTTGNLPNPGDTLIYHEDDGYTITLADEGWGREVVYIAEPVRILHRAPKPKPAWHDAVAVIAGDVDEPERLAVWTAYDVARDYWLAVDGREATGYQLRNIVPLIEAKVTDEMVERVGDELFDYMDPTVSPGILTRVTAAALGIDPA